MTELNVALAGFGPAGAYFHAPLIEATPGLRLAAVVTRDPGRAAAARDAYPEARVAGTVSELLGDADLLVIATPNATHVTLARQAIAAGVPVVVDKPLATTAAEARALADDARGVPLIPFHNRRLDGDFRTVRRLLAAGEVGEPLRFESRFARWRPEPKGGWREQASPADGGGLLLDLGSHLVDQALVLFGPAEAVYAETDRRRPGVRAEDDAFVALHHASGVRSQLWMSAVAADPGPRFRLLGSRAAYTVHGLDPQEDALRAGLRPGPGWGEAAEEDWGRLGTPEATRPVRTEPGAYPRFYAAVERALRGEGEPPVTAADAVAALDVLDAARRAAATGSVVRLS